MKDELIKVAMKTVQESGINGLTMRELGKQVGIKSSSVMYHFQSKDALIFDLMDTYTQNFSSYLEELDASYDDPKIKLIKLVEVFEGCLEQNKLCLAGVIASQSENVDYVTQEKTSEFFQIATAFIEKNLQSVKNSEGLPDIVISALQGALMLDRLDKKAHRLDHIKNWLSGFFE